ICPSNPAAFFELICAVYTTFRAVPSLHLRRVVAEILPKATTCPNMPRSVTESPLRAHGPRRSVTAGASGRGAEDRNGEVVADGAEDHLDRHPDAERVNVVVDDVRHD